MLLSQATTLLKTITPTKLKTSALHMRGVYPYRRWQLWMVTPRAETRARGRGWRSPRWVGSGEWEFSPFLDPSFKVWRNMTAPQDSGHELESEDLTSDPLWTLYRFPRCLWTKEWRISSEASQCQVGGLQKLSGLCLFYLTSCVFP